MFKRLLFVGLGILFHQAAHADEFACSPVDKSDNGDFTFSEICVNDEFAILRTGTFESKTFFYDLELLGDGEYRLTPKTPKDLSGGTGLPITLAIEDEGIGCDSLANSLVRKRLAVILDSGPTEKSAHRAAAFKKREIPIDR